MINVNELRIGNMVRTDKMFLTVTSINKDGIELDGDMDGNAYANYKFEDIFPIELESGLLSNCGFEEIKNYPYRNCVSYVFRGVYETPRYIITGTWFQKVTGHEYYNILNGNLKYLHQLQNLFYFLEGKELTIR